RLKTCGSARRDPGHQRRHRGTLCALGGAAIRQDSAAGRSTLVLAARIHHRIDRGWHQRHSDPSRFTQEQHRMSGDRLIVGIDGGATHTTAVVVDESGTELARVEGGPGIINPADPAACVGRLAVLAWSAITAADAFAPVHALCCALAGAGRPEVREGVRAELVREQIARHVTITTDAEAALADAFGDEPGILLIAGTGSIAWGRAEDGRLVRCGGWGALLGDEGSGYALGLGALGSAARAAD